MPSMISRYDCPEISKLWTDEHKFKTYLKVELALLEALESRKRIPKGTTATIKESAQIDVNRINEIEAVTHHDLIAFCSSITEKVPSQTGKFFHFGVTSSDIIDTALTIQIRESLDIILPELKTLCSSLLAKAKETKDIICMGRSHGMFAEPQSFGQKFLNTYAEFSRRYTDLKDFYDTELTGQLSGAVGNYAILDNEIEYEALSSLKLKVEPVGTQVIPRDRIGKLIHINALIACAIERIAVEIRHLHHSDIQELHEGFAKGQKGSSTMPHKKNPISGENLSGMARVIKSHCLIAQENIPLWHERDISHSSTERMYLPDNLVLLLYSIKRLNKTINNLVIHQEVIEAKVKDNFIYLSSFFLHNLIEKVDLSRESLYEIVQKAAFGAKSSEEFSELIKKHVKEKGFEIDLPKFDYNEIRKVYLKETNNIFSRVEKEYENL